MKRTIFFLTLFLFISGGIYPQSSESYDILIKGGMIFDGSLEPPYPADVALRGDRIVRVAKSLPGKAIRVIDVKGLFICPGFIDLHTHVDDGLYFRENRSCLNYLKQGVTTIIVGQCGGSAWPIFEKAEDLINVWTEEGIGPNAALLVGHGTVRQIVMGMENRAPTSDELEKMKALVKEAMEQGTHGLSTGLIYLPGTYAQTDEIIELVKVIASYGGIYHTHIRDEKDRLLEAVKEAIEISEKTGVPAHVSHFKVMGKSNWGLVKKACALIEEARARGLVITADQYPYQFSSGNPYRPLIPRSTWLGGTAAPSGLTVEDTEKVFSYLRDEEILDLYKKVTPYFPLSTSHQQFLADLPRKRLVSLIARTLIDLDNFRGPESPRERSFFVNRLNNPAEREKILSEVRHNLEAVGPENIVIGICVEKKLEGKSLEQVAAMKGKSVEETAIELELMGAKCIPYQMCEEDIEYLMKKDYVGTGSDGESPFYGIGLTHIRSYSTFLHKIKKYAKERQAVSLSHVIRSQTSLPAETMGWKDRGWIKEGMKADLVILDIKNIRTPTSISNPHQYSQGVVYLFINGKAVLEKGRWNGELPGEVLKLKKS